MKADTLFNLGLKSGMGQDTAIHKVAAYLTPAQPAAIQKLSAFLEGEEVSEEETDPLSHLVKRAQELRNG